MDNGKFSLQAMTTVLEQGLAGKLSFRLKEVLREAYDGHTGQFRASRNSQHKIPFIVHPVGVAKLAIQYYSRVEKLPDDLETVACVAIAHDLLEDTRVASSLIEEKAGAKVRGYVEALTKPPAGIAGRTGQDRNQELLLNILRAGPTAVFVKICDSMHNLGSPSFTPTDLLAKTISKAKNHYLSLLERCPLGDSFREAYVTTIERAEKALVEELKFIRAAPAALTLDDAIHECVSASAGKVLELHDITSILRRICTTERVGCWRLKSSVDGIFEPVAAMGPDLRPLHWPTGELTETSKVFNGVVAQRFGAGFSSGNLNRVITVPFRTDSEAVFVLAIGLGAEIQQTWLNKDSASLLVQFLAHRLILSETDRRGRLAVEAANLGLQLRTEVAQRVGVQPSQLKELQRWRLRCEQAAAIVIQTINLMLVSNQHSIALAKDIKIESRIKTIDSTLLKMLSTHTAWPNYESIEDIAGVRVICLTQVAVAQVEQALLSPRSDVRLHSRIQEPRRDYVSHPTSDGYRALHLILEVETRFNGEGGCTVPCEVQLRTLFQDTWAKVSHSLVYHAGPEAKRHSEQLKQLSGILKSYEESSGSFDNT